VQLLLDVPDQRGAAACFRQLECLPQGLADERARLLGGTLGAGDLALRPGDLGGLLAVDKVPQRRSQRRYRFVPQPLLAPEDAPDPVDVSQTLVEPCGPKQRLRLPSLVFCLVRLPFCEVDERPVLAGVGFYRSSGLLLEFKRPV